MKSKNRKPTHTIRVDDETYKKLRRIAYKLDMTIIDVLREQYVSDRPVRTGCSEQGTD